MPEEQEKKEESVESYRIKNSGGHIEVEVTSGKLTGKTARLIPMPPSGAYFNIPEEKKRA